MPKLTAENGQPMEINDYHNSMFTGEVIHENWVDECAQYLRHIFGDEIAGKRIVDYGFGRGNWSLAFQKLGAKSVISIEASQSAADNFQRHLDLHDIRNISIQVGNTDQEDLELEADIVFLYGIFHHVERPDRLLRSATDWLADANGKVLVYAYDGGSLREVLVSACRKLSPSLTQEHGWEFALHPHARHRAVDDLVAPTVNFWTLDDLLSVVDHAGLDCVAQAKDFAHFQNRSLTPEFDPYVLILKPKSAQNDHFEAVPNSHDYADEYEILGEAVHLIAQNGDETNNRQLVLGLFNSWFAGAAPASFESKIFYLWRYLCHVIVSTPVIHEQPIMNERLEVLVNLTRRIHHEKTDRFESNCLMLKEQIRNGSFRI